MGRASPVRHGFCRHSRLFLVVSVSAGRDEEKREGRMEIKSYLAPFVVAFLVCGGAFLLLDVAVMNMQGLSLIFEQ